MNGAGAPAGSHPDVIQLAGNDAAGASTGPLAAPDGSQAAEIQLDGGEKGGPPPAIDPPSPSNVGAGTGTGVGTGELTVSGTNALRPLPPCFKNPIACTLTAGSLTSTPPSRSPSAASTATSSCSGASKTSATTPWIADGASSSAPCITARVPRAKPS